MRQRKSIFIRTAFLVMIVGYVSETKRKNREPETAKFGKQTCQQTYARKKRFIFRFIKTYNILFNFILHCLDGIFCTKRKKQSVVVDSLRS